MKWQVNLSDKGENNSLDYFLSLDNYNINFKIKKKRNFYILESDKFNKFYNSEQVKFLADKYIDLIKGITKKYLGFNNNIEILKIIKINDDQKFYYDQKDLMCKVCVVPNTKSEIDVDMKEILELSINDEKVNMFFNLMNNNLNEWNNLYKKLEIVIDDLKSSNKYSNWIENSDSITKEKIKQFKQTANSYEAIGAKARHAKNIPAPKKIMKIKNAKMLVNKAVDDWLSLKIK